MKSSSSSKWVNIGTSYATAVIVLLGGIFGLVPPTFNWVMGAIVLFGLTIVLPAIAFFSDRINPRKVAWLYLVVSHTLAFMALIYIAGVDNPFISLWVVMLVVSRLELGWLAFGLSAATLLFGMVIARLVNPEVPSDEKIAAVIVACIITVFLSVFAVLVARIAGRERRSRQELERTRDLERQQYNKLDALINSLSDVVLTVDKEGVITAENAAARNFFDTNQTTVGRNVEDILKLQTLKQEELSLGALLRFSGGIEREDIIRKLSNNEDMRLRIEIHPISQTYGSGGLGSVVIMRDITKQKSLEEEKDEFISVASHELRTPVAVAEGSLSNALVLYEKDASSDLLIANVKEAHKQIEYLSNIINDLTTLSRVDEADELSKEEVSVRQLIKDLHEKYSEEISSHSLVSKISVEDSLPNVITSRVYLEEILQNLISNAIKYTKTGSITLKAYSRGDSVICEVIDTGVGISRADQEKIFDKFYRSEDFHTRETGGSGLGLFIVQKLASKIDAGIKVESKLGEGSTFSISLPVLKEATNN